MAGSISYRKYTSDSGAQYTIKIDKSNASGNIAGDARPLCAVRDANYTLLPRGFKKRYLLAFQSDLPRIKRKFYVGDPTLLGAALVPGATIVATSYPLPDGTAGFETTFVVTAYRGEGQQIASSFRTEDSGLDDGLVVQ